MNTGTGCSGMLWYIHLWRFSQLSWAIETNFEICLAYQEAGPDDLWMSTATKNVFLIMFKMLGRDYIPHTHASIQMKRKKSVALEDGSKSNIGVLSPNSTGNGWREKICYMSDIQGVYHQTVWNSCMPSAQKLLEGGRNLLSGSSRAGMGTTHPSHGLGTSQHAYSNTSKVGRAGLGMHGPGSAIQMVLEQH